MISHFFTAPSFFFRFSAIMKEMQLHVQLQYFPDSPYARTSNVKGDYP